ncbi:hypothetical protein TRVL_05675 [Trypanosoma vivax]|uniref:Uncharacterized protein n=1 Tax=Trypanosoma vivax (strain Y486) TaxID=1055687 RepID=G0U3Y2_TRYVY|nr:hypothetical protein TRVL_05675 [Trypanosoma vivax]CCC52143.1 conserved hypothetical protein [Trypanosoma vivax Y486]
MSKETSDGEGGLTCTDMEALEDIRVAGVLSGRPSHHVPLKTERRVSFACNLVAASWPPVTAARHHGRRCELVGPPPASTSARPCRSEGRTAEWTPARLRQRATTHQAVDSLRLELELPLVTHYRVVSCLWYHCYRASQAEGEVVLPPRPANVISSPMEDMRSGCACCCAPAHSGGVISSTSLKTTDGITLHHLTHMASSALRLHPYSQHLDPATLPIIAFLRNSCTAKLSSRQNNVIGLVPKLMEIIILLSTQLERGAQRRRGTIRRSIHSEEEQCSQNVKRGAERCRQAQTLSLSCLPFCGSSCKNLLFDRCVWWLSRLRGPPDPRPHRLFNQVKELLLCPGIVCNVKAHYLRYIATRFFPKLTCILYVPLTSEAESVAASNCTRHTSKCVVVNGKAQHAKKMFDASETEQRL